MKKKYFIIISIISVLIIIGIVRSHSNINEYLSRDNIIDLKAMDVMPRLDDLPEYEDIEYISNHKSMIIFDSDSIALIVKYNEDTYETEKRKLEDKYTFLNRKVESEFDKTKYFIPENEFSINSYNFRVIDESQSSNIEFPKSFGIIGTSDEKNSIAYLYFYDKDLDLIDTEGGDSPMADFVKEYFKYNF